MPGTGPTQKKPPVGSPGVLDDAKRSGDVGWASESGDSDVRVLAPVIVDHGGHAILGVQLLLLHRPEGEIVERDEPELRLVDPFLELMMLLVQVLEVRVLLQQFLDD